MLQLNLKPVLLVLSERFSLSWNLRQSTVSFPYLQQLIIIISGLIICTVVDESINWGLGQPTFSRGHLFLSLSLGVKS